ACSTSKPLIKTGASSLSDCVLLTFLKKMHCAETSKNLFQPFLGLDTWLKLTGKDGVKDFLRTELGIQQDSTPCALSGCYHFTSINPKAVFTDTFLVSKCINTIWGIWIILGRFPRGYMVTGSLPYYPSLDPG